VISHTTPTPQTSRNLSRTNDFHDIDKHAEQGIKCVLRDYAEPEKYEFCAFSAPTKDSNLLSSVIGQSQLC